MAKLRPQRLLRQAETRTERVREDATDECLIATGAAITDSHPDMNIRILLIDDFPLIREGFAAALETDPALTVVGQADDGEQGLRLARELQPDVVILDL
ncbi:MAG TPA: response regulator transcription factor, partial [Solirubrobacteraceae bacterium]